MSVRSSAMGIANHTPVTSKNLGSIKRKAVINPNVRKKDIIADTFPFDNAVNKAEEKILQPENRKLKEKIANPIFVISKTFSLFPANILAIFSPAKNENKNTIIEIAATKARQIRTTFFNCFTFSPP